MHEPPTPSAPDPAPVHRYAATLAWSGSTGTGYDRYDRTHTGSTPPVGAPLGLSSDPVFRGDPAHHNPEQLLLLAAASCQLLSFLAVAARARLDVVAYADDATAEMPEDDPPIRITAVVLRPAITVRAAPSAALRAKVERLVEVAHRECFIANSLVSAITVVPTIHFAD